MTLAQKLPSEQIEQYAKEVEREFSTDAGELREYQRDFLMTMPQRYSHICTFDEMGIGKTVQLIALDAVRRKQAKGKTLVVAPLTGVIDQWVEEFNKWQPQLNVRRINVKKREWLFRDSDDVDVFIIHPAGLRIMKDELSKRNWLHMIIDEVHTIKNRKAATSKAAVEVGKQAMFRSGGTGTPMENYPYELWHILKWLYPDKKHREAEELDSWTQKLLNSYWRFYERYVDYFEDPETGYHDIQGVKNRDEFAKLFGPFYIRRLKSEVQKDLPPKQWTPIYVDLPPKQRKAYDDMKKEMLAWVGENENSPVVANIAIVQLTRLQQFALGYAEMKEVQKYDRKKNEFYTKREFHLSEPSEKLDALENILSDLGDAQAIVFSTSKQAINLAYDRLIKKNYTCSKVTGDVTDVLRKAQVGKFKDGTNQVLLATIRAGGVGMNLQNCSNVIFLDRDWSPEKNRQAEDRSHRQGQQNPVNIYNIIAKRTVDQRKEKTIEKKWGWIKEMIGA